MTLRSSLRSFFGFAQKEEKEKIEETKPKARGPYFYARSQPSNNNRRQDSDGGYTPYADFSHASSGYSKPQAPVCTGSDVSSSGPTFNFGGSDGGSCGDGGGGE